MHVLFIHQNFPAQFRYIAPRLVQDHGWRCTFLTAAQKDRDLPGVEKRLYKSRLGASLANHPCTRNFENTVVEAHAVYEALKSMPDLEPDLIVAHTGFGSSLFLPLLYDAPIINFMEYFYRVTGGTLGYRPEVPVAEETLLRLKTKNAMILLDLENCTRGWTPTHYQRDHFPPEFHQKIDVIFDGIDTGIYYRRQGARDRHAAALDLPPDVRVVTYVARGFEMTRGFDIFMRAAKRIYQQFPKVVFVVVGADSVHYGADLQHIREKSFRHHVLANDEFDLSKFRFTGFVPEETLADYLSLGDVHIYLTEPFIASWSMVDAMSCGAVLLASDQTCVREYVVSGQNGLLCDFFDVEELARQAVGVLRDPAAYRPLSEAAQQTVRERYSVEVALPRLKEYFQRVAQSRREPSERLAVRVRAGTLLHGNSGAEHSHDNPESSLPGGSEEAGWSGAVSAWAGSTGEPAPREICQQALAQLREQTRDCRTALEWVTACQRFHGPAPWFDQIGPWNHPLDVARLLERLRQWKARTLIDVGDFGGGRVFLWTRFAAEQARLIVAGVPGRTPPGHKMPFFNGLARGPQTVKCVTRHESAAAIAQRVTELMGGRQADFLFLDGLRPLEEVRNDFVRYSRLVRDGGLIAVDGIGGEAPPPPERDGGYRLWQQLKFKIPRHAEYLTGISLPNRGIGVVVANRAIDTRAWEQAAACRDAAVP